jgi:hypothetical protein
VTSEPTVSNDLAALRASGEWMSLGEAIRHWHVTYSVAVARIARQRLPIRRIHRRVFVSREAVEGWQPPQNSRPAAWRSDEGAMTTAAEVAEQVARAERRCHDAAVRRARGEQLTAIGRDLGVSLQRVSAMLSEHALYVEAGSCRFCWEGG